MMPAPAAADKFFHPFADAARTLAALGLAVVPVAGKVPLVAWQRWRRPPGRLAVASLVDRFPNASVGVLTGLSGVTVVDVDDADLIDAMVQRFGPTPLQTATPSGGRHLWYKAAGERCANLREREGLAVDIKGAGGMVLVPPSPGYRFVSGSWADLPRLPHAQGCDFGTHSGEKGCDFGTLEQQGVKSAPIALRAVGVGRRHNTLVKLLLREVRDCDTEAALLDVASTISAEHFELHPDSPFLPAEINAIVAWVWQIESQGRNWVGQEARIMLTSSEFVTLQASPDALTLHLLLLWSHGWRADPFAISCKAMAADESITGWKYPRRFREARDFLLEHGFLTKTHVGGRGPGDPHLYRLASSVLHLVGIHQPTRKNQPTRKQSTLRGRGSSDI